MAHEIKTDASFSDGLLGFSTGARPTRSLRAKVGEKKKDPWWADDGGDEGDSGDDADDSGSG